MTPLNFQIEKWKPSSRSFASELKNFIGPDKDIPAPDVGTNAQTMAWMLDQYTHDTGFSQTGVVTGKPLEIGGSYGREAATGLGVVYVTEKALKAKGESMNGATIAIQGFGKVGSHAAIEADKLGAKIIAVSDVGGAIMNGEGLDIPKLVEYYNQNGQLKGFPGSENISGR